MPDILYAPSREQVLTSNAWAFLHWLRTVRGIDLPDWAALQRWSAGDAAAFGEAIAAFARLPDEALRLARYPGPAEAIVLRRGAERIALTRDELRGASPRRPCPLGRLPAEVAAPLTRFWPPASLIRPLAELLLHADLRPDDRLLVIGSVPWPWLAGLLEGTTIILATAAPATLLATTADEGTTILVAPAEALAEAAFQRARRRPNLGPLRMIIATGGPLSPEGRTRIYTWVKADLMLLARTGDTLWGNPLEPVLARPMASPGFFTRPASGPATP
jgi:hypothetical protein